MGKIERLDHAVGGVFQIHQLRNLVPEDFHQFVERQVFVPFNTVLKVVHNLQSGIHAHVGGHQGLFNGIKRFVIDLGLADNRTRDAFEERLLRFLDAFVK